METRAGFPHFIIYKGAAFDNDIGSLAAILFDNSQTIPGISQVSEIMISPAASSELIEMFSDTSIICGLELSAITMAVFQLRHTLQGRSILDFIYNNAVSGALVRGRTPG